MVVVLHDSPKEGPITEIYVFVASDETGDGIMAAVVGGVATPLVTSKRRIADMMKPVADRTGRMQNKKVKLLRFTTREEVETIV